MVHLSDFWIFAEKCLLLNKPGHSNIKETPIRKTRRKTYRAVAKNCAATDGQNEQGGMSMGGMDIKMDIWALYMTAIVVSFMALPWRICGSA